jgi:GAF domain-containing protein
MGQSPNPEAGARVAALAEYQIMDTPAEAHFDDLVRLASYICRAPIALMSLLDADRQWFKARVGLDTTETPIAYSFCSRTVAEKNMLIVTDTHEDARFRANPLVTGAPYIRFYAGAPLINPAGVALGSLCVIDREPHELDAAQREALVALAGQAIAQLELRRVNRDLAKVLLDKENALDQIRRLQSILPMCSYCRRVRDERNDWYTIEKYLEHLGEVKLSHGICPTCYATAAAEFGESRARPSFKVTSPPIAD